MTYDPRRTPGKPHRLYRAYGPGDVLLYVGASCVLPTRLSVHKTESPWWIACERISFEEYPDRASALEAEKATIRAEAPLFNRRHSERARPEVVVEPHVPSYAPRHARHDGRGRSPPPGVKLLVEEGSAGTGRALHPPRPPRPVLRRRPAADHQQRVGSAGGRQVSAVRMTTHKAECPRCGPQRLDPADIRVHKCVKDPARSFFVFRCVGCGQYVTRAADSAFVRLALSGGSRFIVWDGPSRRPDGPPLDIEDLADLYRDLNSFDEAQCAESATDTGAGDQRPRPAANPGPKP
jgi:hypothetical protein